MKIGFLANEITSFVKHHDSTWALMQAAHDSGDEVFYAHPSSLSIDVCQAFAQFIRLDREFFDYQKNSDAKLIKFPVMPLDQNPSLVKYPCIKLALDDMDAIFMRKDPPVDEAYLRQVQILTLCQKALLINDPVSLMSLNEKLSILNFPDLITQTTVSNDKEEIKDFLKAHGKIVIKPLDGKGGEGIFVVEQGDKNLNVILETSLLSYDTRVEPRPVMVQKYIPEIKSGDKRLILINGEYVAGILRLPSAGDNRGNLAAGGSFAQYQPSARDLEICTALKPFLLDNEIRFAGIDIIGDYLTEINITSPTCLQEIEGLDILRVYLSLLMSKR